MNLDEYKQHIWQQTSILVLCSSTAKNLFPVIVECTNNHSITLVPCLTVFWTYLRQISAQIYQETDKYNKTLLAKTVKITDCQILVLSPTQITDHWILVLSPTQIWGFITENSKDIIWKLKILPCKRISPASSHQVSAHLDPYKWAKDQIFYTMSKPTLLTSW